MTLFFEENGQFKPELVSLFKLDRVYEKGDSLDQVIAKTQKQWIRVFRGENGKERMDLKDPPAWVKIKPEVVQLASKLGFFEGKKPRRVHYDYALLHGALSDGIRFRIKEFLKAYQEGIRFNRVIFLTGARPLKESEKFDGAETEYDLALKLWEEANPPKEIEIVFINAPLVEGCRPTTRDTLNSWMKTEPNPGTILAFSHPLLCIYQHFVTENCLPPSFEIETIAPPFTQLESESIVSLIFDTIAKSLFEISFQQKRK